MAHSTRIRALLCGTLLSSAIFASPAQAAIFTVGTPVGAGQCTHATIQAAVAAAEGSPGADTIRITRSQAYTAQAVTVATSQHLNIVGGFATCNQATTDNVHTTVSGAGGAAEPVFRITGNTGAIIKIRHLTITEGDEDGSGYGGGIYFRGNGILELIETTVSNSIAGYGGGVYAEGTGSDTELVIGNDVLIVNNTARYSGGGVYADGVEMSMDAPGSSIAFNQAVGVLNPVTGQTAGGYGGGIQIVGSARDGYVYIGSPGSGGIGPVYANEARYGGGISVMSVADGSSAELRVYSTDPVRQTAIRDNFASVAGGGLYVWAEDRGGFVVGHMARAYLYNASIVDNAAPAGSAAHLQRTPGLFPVGYSTLEINPPFESGRPGALPCPDERPCARISGNIDLDLGGNPTGGPVVFVDSHNDLFMERTELSNNRGGRVVRAIGDDTSIEAVNTLWSGNSVSQELIRTEDDVDTLLENTTLAGNVIGAGHVISSNGRFRIQRSVLWQPGTISLAHSGDAPFAQNVVASERQSLDGGNTPYVLQANPRFVDPAHSDFRLRAASPAVDFASSGGGPDLVGVMRGIDLPIKANRMGSGDLGAFERPALLPLVLNPDFDHADLRLWTWYAGEWDGTQNVAGGAGSGSWKYAATGLTQLRVYVGQQCIHVPGPGRYLLNGRGRAGGSTIATRDYAILVWEFRRDGSELCNAGAPEATGQLVVGAGTNWGQGTQPAIIDISPQDWTHNSSITITLTAEDGGITSPRSISAWFDGITLDVEDGDIIFQDDFEP